MSFKEISWLGLKIPDFMVQRYSEDHSLEINCFSDCKGHELHAKNSQLNLLTDMIINLAMKLEESEKINRFY